MEHFVYSATLTPDPKDGGFVNIRGKETVRKRTLRDEGSDCFFFRSGNKMTVLTDLQK